MATMPPTHGFITSTTPTVIVSGMDNGTLAIRTITLYNPNSTAVSFVLRLVVEDESDSDQPFIRFDDDIPALDTWVFGLTGTPIMLVPPGYRYEVVLDSLPASGTGIHWVCDLLI